MAEAVRIAVDQMAGVTEAALIVGQTEAVAIAGALIARAQVTEVVRLTILEILIF
jgi:hypothetical protein